MKYDIRLQLEYAYRPPVAAGRHLVRVAPMTLGDAQRVVASSIVFDPVPVERTDGRDFFGNAVVSVAYRDPHAKLSVGMSARVVVIEPGAMLDVSPDLATLGRELAGVLSLAPDSPHHFTAPARASRSTTTSPPMRARASSDAVDRARDRARPRRAHPPRLPLRQRIDRGRDDRRARVFELRRGVCQDFSHVMIAGLRGIGIPAAYVSGFLRTIPPPGEERLAGADAMHAWVRAWCGNEAGWVGYDPTNDIFAGENHIVVAIGRDYQDVAPIAGILQDLRPPADQPVGRRRAGLVKFEAPPEPEPVGGVSGILSARPSRHAALPVPPLRQPPLLREFAVRALRFVGRL